MSSPEPIGKIGKNTPAWLINIILAKVKSLFMNGGSKPSGRSNSKSYPLD